MSESSDLFHANGASDTVAIIALPTACTAQIHKNVEWFDSNLSRRSRAALGVREGKIVAANEHGERREGAVREMTISSRLGSAPRRFVFADGTAIVVADNDAADNVIRQADGRGAFLHQFESGRHIVLLLIAAAAMLCGVFVYALPATADFVARRMPQTHLKTISDYAYTTFLRQGFLEDSTLPPQQQEHIQKIFDNAVSPFHHQYDYQLRFHQLGTANAFALPSGLIIVSDLLAKKLSDDELLAILLHEIGHVEERHGMRNVLASAGTGLFLALLGDVSFVVSGGAALLQFKYSRSHETEADCFAARQLLLRNMPPTLLGVGLHKISGENKTVTDDDVTDVADTDGVADAEDKAVWEDVLAAISTHPNIEDRVNLEKVCGLS